MGVAASALLTPAASGFDFRGDADLVERADGTRWVHRSEPAGPSFLQRADAWGKFEDAKSSQLPPEPAPASTTYEVGRYRVGQQCTRAASAQFKNSKRFTVDFMNSKFGGAMPPLVLVTVVKPRDVAWDHAYNANVIDVTSHGFIVEVARLDKDAGWCYDLDLTWMAYGFADMAPG